jgi:hypothetical protein
MIRKAVIEDNYRYQLYREWDAEKPCILWIMLNPSIADGEKDDPTIKKIVRISDNLGFGSLYVGNLYAYICTDSNQLFKKNIDYKGPYRYLHLQNMLCQTEKVILACGRKAKEKDLQALMKMMKVYKNKIYCLKINKDGTPAHPLYLPEKNIKLIEYRLPEENER